MPSLFFHGIYLLPIFHPNVEFMGDGDCSTVQRIVQLRPYGISLNRKSDNRFFFLFSLEADFTSNEC